MMPTSAQSQIGAGAGHPEFTKVDAVSYRWYAYADGRWSPTCWSGETEELAAQKRGSPLFLEMEKFPLKLICERTTFMDADAAATVSGLTNG